jgi:hypothetical protein
MDTLLPTSGRDGTVACRWLESGHEGIGMASVTLSTANRATVPEPRSWIERLWSSIADRGRSYAEVLQPEASKVPLDRARELHRSSLRTRRGIGCSGRKGVANLTARVGGRRSSLVLSLPRRELPACGGPAPGGPSRHAGEHQVDPGKIGKRRRGVAATGTTSTRSSASSRPDHEDIGTVHRMPRNGSVLKLTPRSL